MEISEEIIVTGSRISRQQTGYTGSMSVIEIENIERTPNYSVQDMLLKLPSIGLQGTSRNNSSGGGRGANFSGIHQLTPERTLVLLNGRRMVHTIRDSLGLGVDMQSFPINMIDSIEVLADGASAIYGSDAVAGVINVKTRRFEGIEFNVGAGLPEDPGGDSYNAGMIAGLAGERGHVTLAATIVDTGKVDFQQRNWSKVPILGQLDSGDGAILTLMGSGIPPEGRQPDAGIIFKPDPATGASFQPYDTFGFSGLNGSAGDGSLQSILDTGHRFNYSDIQKGLSLLNEAQVVNGSIIGELELDNASVYYELLGTHREGTLKYTPLPIADALGGFTNLLQVPFTNPHIPTDAIPVIRAAVGPDATQFQMWWRALDLGNRLFRYSNDTMKATAGLRGNLPLFKGGWEYDAWFTYGRSTLDEITNNQVNVAKLQTALNPIACKRDPACPKDALGNPTLDIFGRGVKSQAEIDYVLFDDEEATRYEIWHLAGALTGELWTLPAGTVDVAAGLEWRHESGSVRPSATVQAGHSGGNFAEPTEGDFSVWEFFAEFHIPLLEGQTFAEDLSLDAAARYSDYNTVGSEATFKLALHWEPVNALKFRGIYATGFRSPNILESFGGTADTFPTVADPCNTAADLYRDNATVRGNCAGQGIPSDYVQNASQLKISAGGNPELKPETSDSFSVGLIWTPDEIGNLSLAIDYYNVQVDDAINTPDPVDVILTCYTTPNLAAPECDRIRRGPSGTITRFDLLNENLARLETSGIDVSAAYILYTDYGDVSLTGNVNWLNEYVETTDSGAVSDRTDMVAGNVSDWAGYPEWRSNLSVTLSRNNWTIGGSWRYLDAMDIFDTIEFDNVHKSVDAVHYFDLFGNYRGAMIDVTIGAENLTDETPPYVPDVALNTSSIYDYLGRFYYIRLKYGFY
ncbi:MAG: TonB-dependent receptor [Gammaproteobacteria bacterium]|nr:TonB-dependent receptor [Gammaproteobacteria bacterium]